MSPQAKSDLAREHLKRASVAFEAGDPVVGVTFLYLAAEAAIVALSEQHDIATERQHWRKAEAAAELHTRGILPIDLSSILELLNQARKDVGYEGEDPDFGDHTPEDLLSSVEIAVDAAEQATHPAENSVQKKEGAAANTIENAARDAGEPTS
jgi:hypothetical protein